MADEKISQLADATAPQAADQLAIARAGGNYALTFAELQAAITSVTGNAGTATKLATARNIDGQSFDGSANVTVIAPGTHAATSKATPVDADEIPLADSAASFVLKKLTWANLKATIKAYTDTLYPSGSGTSTGTNTGDQTTVSGNAGTATALQTGRTIDGQTFDGTANITVIAPGTHAATSKTTPADADEIPIVDSAASNTLKKLTGTNLKAYLKTYFDTLYQATGSVTSVFGRSGVVVATSGDYTAAQVTNAADKSSSSAQTFSGGVVSANASGGIGYATGAGGAVTQLTSKGTAVSINKVTGQITTHNATLASGATASFLVNNSTIGSGDMFICQLSAGYATSGTYTIEVINLGAAGSPGGVARIRITNISAGGLGEALVLNFAVIKGVAS